MFGSRRNTAQDNENRNNVIYIWDKLKMPPLLHAFLAPEASSLESMTRSVTKSPKLHGDVSFHDPVGGVRGFSYEVITIGCVYASALPAIICGFSAWASVANLLPGDVSILNAIGSAGVSFLSGLATYRLWSYGNKRAANQLNINKIAYNNKTEPTA